jgi:uncharacterized protein
MFREPPFRHFSPFLKILALIMLMIIIFLFFMAIGAAASLLIFGRGALDNLALLTDYTNPRTVAELKFFQIVNQMGVFIVPAFIFVIFTDDHIGHYLGLDVKVGRISTLLGFIVLIVSLPFINWLLDLNGQLHLPSFLSRIEQWMKESEDSAQKLTDAFLSTKSWGGLLVNLVMIGGLAAIGEELIFRGILVKLFREWTGNVHLSVFIPALMFSALHLQFYGFFGRLMLGMMLGYLFVWTRSLWVPIIVHFMNNAMAVILSFLIQRGIVHTKLETFGSSKNGFVIAASAILMILVMTTVYYHEKKKMKRKEMPGIY